MTKSVLGGFGYTVIESSNGIEALSMMKEDDSLMIDCLVTDMIMPEMGEKELSKELQKKYPSPKVLFISGYSEESISQGGVLNEGCSFL